MLKLIITVDTEADNQWKLNRSVTLDNIQTLPRFQELCERYGFRPTYLVTHEVASDPASCRIIKPFQDAGQAEIGAHLHPWTTPPFHTDPKIESAHRFPSELADDELQAKLTTLTQTIHHAFDVTPTSYRAGRWGFDARQIRILKNLGYVADTSITPTVSWSTTRGGNSFGPDFSNAPFAPYELSFDDCLSPGNSGIIELPMTILHTGTFRRQNDFWSRRFRALPSTRFKRGLDRLFWQTRWLRIFSTTTRTDFENLKATAEQLNLPHLQFMIHSSELALGQSPYSKTPKALENIWFHLESLLRFAKSHHMGAQTLTEAARDFVAQQCKLRDGQPMPA